MPITNGVNGSPVESVQQAVGILNRPRAIPGSLRVIPNRIVYQPMEINSADPDGTPSERDFDVLRLQL